MEVLQNLIHHFHQRQTLVLLDVKRGDIGSTSLAYAKAYLGPHSPYQADAITVTPYLGFGAIQPILDYAVQVKAGVFIVIRSSNPEGEWIQNALLQSAHDQSSSPCTVADYLAREVTTFNQKNISDFSIGPCGAVIGATLQNISHTLQLLPHSLFLAPGVGYQGASIQDLLSHFSGVTDRVIPTSSRAVLAKGPHPTSLQKAIQHSCQEAFQLIHSNESSS